MAQEPTYRDYFAVNRLPEPQGAVVAPLRRRGETDPWLARNPAPPPKIGFWEALLDRPSKVVPFLGAAIGAKELWDVRAAAQRVREGTASQEDEDLVLDFMREARRDHTFGGRIGQILGELPAFMAEFWLTGGGFTLGKKAGTKAVAIALEKALGAGIAKSAGGRALAKVGGVVAGSALQSAGVLGKVGKVPVAVPARLVQEIYRAALPEMNLDEDQAGNMAVVFAATEDDFWDAVPEGIKRNWVEYVSERSGAAFAKMPGSQVLRELQGKVFSKLVGGKGAGAVESALRDIMGKAGWHGWLEEIGEERVNSALLAALGEDPWSDVWPGWEQLAAEGVAFAVPGAVLAGTRKVLGETPEDRAKKEPEEKKPKEPPKEGEPAAPKPQEPGPQEGAPATTERPSTAPATPAAGRAAAGFFQRNAKKGRIVGPTEPDDYWAVEFESMHGRQLVLVEAEDGQPMDMPAASAPDGVTVLDVNARGGKKSLIFHEAVHGIPEQDRAELQELVATGFEEWAQERRAAYEEEYARAQEALPESARQELTPEQLDEEALARGAEELAPFLEWLYDNPRRIQEAYKAKPNLVRRIFEAIARVLNTLPRINIPVGVEKTLAELRATIQETAATEELSDEQVFELAQMYKAAIDLAVPRAAQEGPATQPAEEEETFVEGPEGTQIGLRRFERMEGLPMKAIGVRAIKEGVVVGTAAFSVEGKRARGVQIRVAKPYQRKGIGRAMVEAVQAGHEVTFPTTLTEEGRAFVEALTKPTEPTKPPKKKPTKAKLIPTRGEGGGTVIVVEPVEEPEAPVPVVPEPEEVGEAASVARIRVHGLQELEIVMAGLERDAHDNIFRWRSIVEEVEGLGWDVLKEIPGVQEQLDELRELAAVMAARKTAQAGVPPHVAYTNLVRRYQAMPKLGAHRTSEKIRLQQFSTPPPLSFLVSHLAGIDRSKTVYEPAAGNGSLLIAADPAKVHANELDEGRAGRLTYLGLGKVTTADATIYEPAHPAEVVITNPPFGKQKDPGAEKAKTWQVSGFETNEIDQAIALRALRAMKKGGRAVLLLGGPHPKDLAPDKRRAHYRRGKQARFYKHLYDNYSVREHFIVDGGLYDRMGSAWPIEVIVIDGAVQTTARRLPGLDEPVLYTSWDALEHFLRLEPAQPRPEGSGGPATEEGSSTVTQGVRGTSPAEDRGDGGRGGEQQPAAPGLPGGREPTGEGGVAPAEPAEGAPVGAAGAAPGVVRAGEGEGAPPAGGVAGGAAAGERPGGGGGVGVGEPGPVGPALPSDADLDALIEAEIAKGEKPAEPPSPEEDPFERLGTAQRGEPEQAMREVQRAMGGGVLSVVVEHVGDLTHRMTLKDLSYGWEWVKEKVEKGLQYLEHKYGFEREMEENIRSNARFKKIPEPEFRERLAKALDRYAAAHRALPVFNDAQVLAQRAAVSVAEGRYSDAIKALRKLKLYVDLGPEGWSTFAGESETTGLVDAPGKKPAFERWRGVVTIGNQKTGQERDLPVEAEFPPNTPVVDISDELSELATRGLDMDKVWEVLNVEVVDVTPAAPEVRPPARKPKKPRAPRRKPTRPETPEEKETDWADDLDQLFAARPGGWQRQQPGRYILRDSRGGEWEVQSIHYATEWTSTERGWHAFDYEGEYINTYTTKAAAQEAVEEQAREIGRLLFAVRPEGFDEEKYKKAVPAFQKAAEVMDADIGDIGSLVGKVIQYLRNTKGWAADRLRAVAVYLREFAKDVSRGIIGVGGKRVDVQLESEGAFAGERTLGAAENVYQVTYAPFSRARSVSTLIPVHMQESMHRALTALQARVGDIDEYVAKKLGYERLSDVVGTEEDFGYFSGEQIDALALAIDNIERGRALITGDQTGVGKGRIAAGLIRYAVQKGVTPIFVTAKKGLYADMMRDLEDIGSGDLVPFITNRGLTGGQALPLDSGGTLSGMTTGKLNRAYAYVQKHGELPTDRDVVFTTYSQLQLKQSQENERHHLFEKLIRGSLLIMDESHYAGGSDVAPAELAGRAALFRKYVGQAWGVYYSSATFAKNPSVMSLYSRTDMSLAVDSPEELGDAIKAGGVPLQEIVAAMLTGNGQYIRREKSFDGIDIKMETVGVETGSAEGAAELLLKMFQLDLHMREVRETFIEVMLAEEGEGAYEDQSIGGAGAASTTFSAIMHNIVSQMLLVTKVDSTVDFVKQKVESGDKVVVGLSNTLGAIMDHYLEGAEVAKGESMDGFTFNEVFGRYHRRMREVTIKPADGGPGRRRYITDSEIRRLGFGELLDQWSELMQEIEDSGLGLPGSPIDTLVHRLEAEGIRVGEITGRSAIIDADGNLDTRDASDGAKKRLMARFNGGTADAPIPESEWLDVLVINRSGAEGYSLHANASFGDKKPRHMVILQPEPNIDTFMQMLGRINRTGQVELPRYTLLSSIMPGEKRPFARLMSKLASLNANTSANKESALTLSEVVDFMNPWGDQVVAELLREEPLTQELLDVSVPEKEHDDEEVRAAMIDGLAAKATGRIAMLPLKQQEDLYQRIELAYLDHVEAMRQLGKSLSAPLLQLGAKTISSRELRPGGNVGKPGETTQRRDLLSVFEAPSMIETADVLRLVEPLPWSEVKARVSENQSEALVGEMNAAANEYRAQLREEAERRARAADEAIRALEEQRDKLDRQIRELAVEMANAPDAKAEAKIHERIQSLTAKRTKLERKARKSHKARQTAGKAEELFEGARSVVETALRNWVPGTALELSVEGELPVFAVVTEQRRVGRSVNPLALSDWQLVMYTSESKQALVLPFSKVNSRSYELSRTSLDRAKAAFEEGLSEEKREIREIVTGNLLTGFAELGRLGRLVRFTREDGSTDQGLLVKRDKKVLGELEQKPVPVPSSQVVEFLDQVDQPEAYVIERRTKKVSIKKVRGNYYIEIPARGGKAWYLHPGVIAIVGQFRQLRGQKKWTAVVSEPAKVAKALKVYEDTLGAVFVAEDYRNIARDLTGRDQVMAVRTEEEHEPLFGDGGFPTETAWQAFRRHAQDYFLVFRRLRDELEAQGVLLPERQDPVLAEELWVGRVEERVRRLFVERVRPMLELLQKHEISLQDVAEYVYARHAERRNKVVMERNPGKPFGQEINPGSGMRRSTANRVLAEAHAGPNADVYRQLGEMFDEMNRESVARRVKYGLMTDEQAREWRRTWGPHYAPLRSDFADQAPMRVGKGFDVRGKESKRAMGRQSLADNPFAFAIMQAEESILRAEKARVGQRVLQLVRENPDPSLWQVTRRRIKTEIGPDGVARTRVLGMTERAWKTHFSVKEDGKEYHIRFSNELMPRALKKMHPYPAGKFTRGMSTLMRAYAALNTTFSPDFLVSNFFRDLGTAGVHLAGEQKAGMAKAVVKDVFTAQRAVWYALREKEPPKENKKLYAFWEAFNEARLAGGKIGWHHAHGNLDSKLKRMQKEIDRLGPAEGAQRVYRFMREAGELVGDLNGAVENGVRLSAYYHARKAGLSKEAAASLMRNLTVNFNRRGELGPIINAWYLFYNAGIQGSARMLYSLGRSPTTRKIVAGIAAFGLLMDFLNRLGAGDDDDGENRYDKIPDYIKDRHLVVMLDALGGDGDYLKIPLPYGYNVFYALGRNLMSMMPEGMGGKGDSLMTAFGNVATTTVESFSPLGSESSFLQIASPTILDPIVQTATNEKFYGAPIKPGQVGYGPEKPESQLYWSTVNPRIKALSAWLNAISGGDEYTSGLVDISPEVIEHWIEFLGGGTGRAAYRLWELPEKVLADEPVVWDDIPVVRRLIGEPAVWYTRTKFYENLERIELLDYRYRQALKKDPVAAARLRSENLPAFRLIAPAKLARKQAKAVRDRGGDPDEVMTRFNRRFVEAGL